MASQEDLKRLGEYVRVRRTELLLTQQDVTRAGGLSNASQTKLEGGKLKRINLSTLDKLDLSMKWERGSAQATLNGGEPTPLEGTNHAPLSQRHSSVLDAINADTALRDHDKAVLYDQYLEMLRSYKRPAQATDDEAESSDSRRIA